MSDLIRWDPMRELLSMRDNMDRLFDNLYARQSVFPEMGQIHPAVDVMQTENEIIVKATLAGVKPDDLQISITGDTLTIRGEVKKEEEISKGSTYHLRERVFGSFSRSFTLPVSVVADDAHAEFEDGILTLTLPKAKEARPRTITIKTK